MCGFTGILNHDHQPVDPVLLLAMSERIKHRGPDDEGTLFVDTKTGNFSNCITENSLPSLQAKMPSWREAKPGNLGLSFRRLSILDVSENGHQPIGVAGQQTWMVFNGEVYNYIELRKELIDLGHQFTSEGDTEVVLKSYLQWGKDCLQRFNGMFGLAIWDGRKQELFCARDRFGIKPFYFVQKEGKAFYFASEIKAFPEKIRSEANPSAIYDFLYFDRANHTTNSFFKGVQQLRGGQCLTVKNGAIKVNTYYSLKESSKIHSEREAIEEFREALLDAIKMRQRSDVPLGYSLSGGLDSSSITVGAHHHMGSEDQNTFSLVFPGTPIDESPYIQEVIKKTGFNHFFVTPSAEDFEKDLDNFVWHHEEPVPGTSYYGDYKLRQLYKEHGVTVSLEGQGADEIITGYDSFIRPYLYDALREGRLGDFKKQYNRFEDFAGLKAVPFLKSFVTSHMHRVKKPNLLERSTLNHDYFTGLNFNGTILPDHKAFKSSLNKSLYESLIYLTTPDQVLHGDKNAMAFSLEARFPFLDHRVVEKAFQIPGKYKIMGGRTKHILREAMKDLLPDPIYKRQDKIGFATPQSDWLSGPLQSFVSNLSAQKDFRDQPFVNAAQFDIARNQLNQGDHRSAFMLWKIISVHLWLKAFNLNLA